MVTRPAHPRRSTHADRSDSRDSDVVAGLVDAGLVDPDRSREARAVVRAALDHRGPAETPLRRRLAEVAGYVGGALVVAAAVIFLTQEWESLSTAARVTTLSVIGVVLFAAAVSVVLLGRRAGADGGDEGVRRRLASALGSGGAVAVAFAVGVLVETMSRPFSDAPWAAGGLALVVAALVGYRLAPSALGQVTMAVGAATAVGSGLNTFVQTPSEIWFALAMMAVGAVWLSVAGLRLWWEHYTALVIGCVFLLFGAQFPMLGSDHESAAYLLTGGVAVAALVLYIRTRSVPYLVTAVAAITLAVPQALLDWTDDSLGPVGVLLATGATLLVASLLGLRLRQEVAAGAQTGAAG